MLQSPTQRYQADLDSGAIVPDEAQRIAVDALQDLYLRLEDRSKIKPGFLDRFLIDFGTHLGSKIDPKSIKNQSKNQLKK